VPGARGSLATSWLDALDRAVGAIIAAGRLLVLPVSFLLFAQWPLRDLVQAHSTEANDLAQWLFALYVGLAMTYATRERAHLAADALAHRYPPALRRLLARSAALLFLAPWSLFILVASAPTVWRSVAQLEEFPETYSPGYFLVKLAAWLLALLVLLQALLDGLRPATRP